MSTITATATVDGQTYTRNVDVRFEPATQSLLGDWLDRASHKVFGGDSDSGATSVTVRNSIIDGSLVATQYDVTIDIQFPSLPNYWHPRYTFRGPVTGNSFSGQSIATYVCTPSVCFTDRPYDGVQNFYKVTLMMTLNGDTLTVVIRQERLADGLTLFDTSMAKRVDAVPNWL